MPKLWRDDDDSGYCHVKKVNRTSTKLQALVHGRPYQLTTREILGTFVAIVHTLRTPLGSVRESTEQPRGSSHSLVCMEKFIPWEKGLSHTTVNCPVVLNQSGLFYPLNPVHYDQYQSWSANNPLLTCQTSWAENNDNWKGFFFSLRA